jgi:hypothetical protein
MSSNDSKDAPSKAIQELYERISVAKLKKLFKKFYYAHHSGTFMEKIIIASQ